MFLQCELLADKPNPGLCSLELPNKPEKSATGAKNKQRQGGIWLALVCPCQAEGTEETLQNLQGAWRENTLV